MPFNVNITPRLEAILKWKVASGSYTSASDIVRETLRLMKGEDRMRAMTRDALRQNIREYPDRDA